MKRLQHSFVFIFAELEKIIEQDRGVKGEELSG